MSTSGVGGTASPSSDATTHPLGVAALASGGAAVLHAAAAGAHTDPVVLGRIFVVTALVQAAAAVAASLRPGRAAALALTGANAPAFGGWLVTRLTGLSDVPGLEVAQAPGLADSAAAALAAIAVAAASPALVARPGRTPPGGHLTTAAVVVAALVTPGLFDLTSHGHDGHGESAAAHVHGTGEVAAEAAPDDHGHTHGADTGPATPATTDGSTVVATTEGDSAVDHHDHPTGAADDHHDTAAPAAAAAAVDDAPDRARWPRPYDPHQPLDLSGVPGVTAEQAARAERLIADTLRELPAFADVTTIADLGYRSIGDARTGHEHFINFGLLSDDKVLDPRAPESLVYRVDDLSDPAARTLVSAMFIAQATGVDDPELVDFGGPLMQWHHHTNLCWGRNLAGDFVVMGVTDDHGGTCPEGQVNTGGQFPMVHVWIAPHECGPFAALEGHGAGQAGVLDAAERADLCAGHDHATGHPTDDPTGLPGAHADGHGPPVPYDPTRPIDLGGVAGVTPEQQAFAENLVADVVRNLPQWADHRVAEAAGFRSIGDAGTGHEHFIQWDWIDDDVVLDPDFPESLVYEPQPDGTRRLVSAMFMLPSGTPIDAVPDWGGALMQWHVHGDLCFTDDPVAPQVAGTRAIGAACPPPLVELGVSPMIHVWIVPTPCGPFAALEGIGAGQVAPGEEARCDHAHGAP